VGLGNGLVEAREEEREMRCFRTKYHVGQAGFSILEMMMATVILLVGLVAVAELVPASVFSNQQSRAGSAALIFAQRELDQMLDQPLPLSTFNDAIGNTCSLGLTGSPSGTFWGSPVQVSTSTNGGNGESFSQVIIDFNAAKVPNYSFNYPDPTDPTGVSYDIRWAVIVMGSGPTVSAKRFILGVRQEGGNGFFAPVTLDTMVER
jgi:prepilin-type N-terminal cleavage/methylation domain-containing protein